MTAAVARLERVALTNGHRIDSERVPRSDAGEWEKPLPFESATLPVFPVDALPLRLRRYVSALAEATQTPVDLPAMVVLGMCAGAVARKAVVLVKPGYLEPLNIMSVSVAAPANRKTAVYSAAAAPLEEEERELVERAKPEIANAQAKRAALEESAKGARQDLKQAETDADRAAAEAKLAQALRELARVAVPTLPRLLWDDVTPERAAVGMAENGERAIIASPEGGVFDSFLGRYSKDGQANIEVLLKGHAGDTLRVDRLAREPVFLKHPALTLVLTVQPFVIQSLARKPGTLERGLMARLLYSLPTSRVGERDVDAPPVPETVRADYSAIVRALVGLPMPSDGSAAILRLDGEAYARWRAFAAEIEPRLHQEKGDLAAIDGWAGKLVGTVARIAGVLHCAERAVAGTPLDVPIGAGSVDAAVAIGRYLIPHALAAFGAMRGGEHDEDARALLRWLRRREQTRVTVRDVQRGLSRRFRSAEQVTRAMRTLEERGYVRQSRPEPYARTTAPTFDVHPQIATDTTDMTDNTEKGS